MSAICSAIFLPFIRKGCASPFSHAFFFLSPADSKDKRRSWNLTHRGWKLRHPPRAQCTWRLIGKWLALPFQRTPMSDLDLFVPFQAAIYVAALLAGKLSAPPQCLSQARAGFNEEPLLHPLLIPRVQFEIHNLIGNWASGLCHSTACYQEHTLKWYLFTFLFFLLRSKFHTIISSLGVWNSVDFTLYHCHQFQSIFITLNGKPYPLSPFPFITFWWQQLIYCLSLQIFPFWILHISGIMQYGAFLPGFIHLA